MRFLLLKFVGAPGSVAFFAGGTVIALGLMLSMRTRRLGVWTLLSLVLLYAVLSLPAVAHALSARVTRQFAVPGGTHTPAAELFVLDGDNYLARAALAADLYAAGPPRTVWVLGGDALRDALLAQGIPRDRWRWGGVPDPSTHGQAVQMQHLMTEHGLTRGVAIVSRIQAPRVVGLVRRLGLPVDVASAPLDREPRTTGAGRWTPDLAALALSRDAIYEWAALAYYRWKGWV